MAILENSRKDFKVIKYLEKTISKEELHTIIKKLNISPIEIVRKNEKIWKENFKGKELSNNDIVNAMVAYPKLIERPIVIDNNKAIIGRPPEIIKDFI